MSTPDDKLTRRCLFRAALGAVAVVAGLIAASNGRLRKDPLILGDEVSATEQILVVGGSLLILLGGLLAVRSIARALRSLGEEHIGDARGASLAFVWTISGYALILILVLQALKVDLGGLLVGGAITGVVLGIAAQQTLGNFFAGLVLLINRPFAVGEHIVLRSGPLGGEYDGRVTDISLFYIGMVTETGPVALPNAHVLMSAIGPGAKAPVEDEEEDEEEGKRENEPTPTGAGGAPDHSKGITG
jgi:small-conductance mechanosensitive channel